MKTFDCVVIGAGISGLVAAKALRDRGLSVVVVDKGRGVGGRMATRRMGDARCDHGAQFFTVSDERFQRLVDEWVAKGAAQPWYQVEGGPLRYRGLPSMTGVAKHLAHSCKVYLGERIESVSKVNGLWSLDVDGGILGKRLLITCPAPQSLALLESSEMKLSSGALSELSKVKYRKALVALLTLDGPSGLEEPGFIKFSDGGALDVLADNRLKGVSGLTSITLHSSHDFADEYWDRPSEEVIDILSELAGPHLSSSVVSTDYHRWGFAHRVGEANREFLEENEQGLWFAGDSFATAKVEGAALSGLEAARSIADSF